MNGSLVALLVLSQRWVRVSVSPSGLDFGGGGEEGNGLLYLYAMYVPIDLLLFSRL